VGPVTRPGARIGARLIDLLLAGIGSWALLQVVGDSDKPFTGLFLVFLVLFAYETVAVATTGSTPGHAACGMRVVELDREGAPGWSTAATRGAVSAALISVPVIGWGLWLVAALGDPLRRGFEDRAAGTMAVPQRAATPIWTSHLPGYVDAVRRPRLTTLGRVADHDLRGRARLRRLDHRPVLAAAVGLLALAAALPFATWVLVVATGAAWIVVFVVDETRTIARDGATPGHQLAALVVRDRATGGRPSTGRALARAIVLGLTLYVPLLWPLLAISVLRMRYSPTGAALHDLAGRTIVVHDPSLSPEQQRQVAMQLRLGRAT
jgi:uncharacterized RDD family membrane protein YckC